MQPLGGERQSSHRSERKLSTLQEQRQLICSWYFGQGKSKSRCVLDHAKFFKALGQRVKDLRKRHGYSQEDMISFGFSARHWQQIEAGRPITVTTLLRICEVLKIRMDRMVRGLDRGLSISESNISRESPLRRVRSWSRNLHRGHTSVRGFRCWAPFGAILTSRQRITTKPSCR